MKKTNKDNIREENNIRIRKAYEELIAVELSVGPDTQHQVQLQIQHQIQHPGFLLVFLPIEGDIRDFINICLN